MAVRKWLVGLVGVALVVGAVGQGSAVAETIFQHVGNTDPGTEGWVQFGSPGGGVTDGAVTNDLGQGIDAWFIDDDSTTVPSRLSYKQTPTDAQISRASSLGWKLSARLRVVDVDQPPTFTVGVRYSNGTTRYGMLFGSDDDGDPIVTLGEGAVNRLVVGPSFTLEHVGSSYHLYELEFAPAVGSASLFVDGTQRLSGYTGVNADTKRVFWGSNSSYKTGHGNYNLVRWEIVPAPSTLVGLLSMGLIGALGYVWRRRRRVA